MPMQREHYPADWDAISLRIREREAQRCKFCGVENHTYGARAIDGSWVPEGETAMRFEMGDISEAEYIRKPKRIVLTVAHLDHDMTNNDESNLAALCQQCHLRHDAQQHAQNAARTRKRKRYAGQLELGL